MCSEEVRVTIVNHVESDMEVSPRVVWNAILDEYVEAKKFLELGYSIEPLDDLAAVEGGYRMRFVQDGALVDDRICRITERDDTRRRLSMVGNFLSTPSKMVVYVTYHAAQTATGARYTIDCHSSLNLDLAEGSDSKQVKAAVTELTEQFGAALASYLAELKTKLEADMSKSASVER